MKSQFVKDLYYLTVGKASIVPYCFHRAFPSRRFDGAYVNIGCGPDYVDGMVNVDGNVFRKKDLWLDVTLGLPFRENSVAGIYASHIVEHFDSAQVRGLFRQFYRALRPGGAVRIVVPSLEFAIQAYVDSRQEDLPDWPESFQSIGGRFNNFTLVANQHLLIFDFTFLQELLAEAGFEPVTREVARQSRHFNPQHMQYECRDVIDTSLYVEALKPDGWGASNSSGKVP